MAEEPPSARPTPPCRHADTPTRRHAIEAEHDEVRDAYAACLCDVLAILDRPALDDVTVPQTAAHLHAMDTAADAHRGSDLDAYPQTITALKTAPFVTCLHCPDRTGGNPESEEWLGAHRRVEAAALCAWIAWPKHSTTASSSAWHRRL